MSGSVRAHRVTGGGTGLLDPAAPHWGSCSPLLVTLTPAPVALVSAVSPYVAASTGHGRVPQVEARAAHDGAGLWLRLAWPDSTCDDHVSDLDRFADAAAVLFPLAAGADPFLMGSPGKPVNAWLWRADTATPFDVIAEGYGTSRRRPATVSGLAVRAQHDGRGWTVVFQRPLTPRSSGCVALAPDAKSAVAFAVWDGSERDRSAQKAVSTGLLPLEIDA
ncbi:ethylbenzene dehydrogenase-related protein [Candidatus Binatia bacterium]|nr:ethylbenzene dehydrogenase-related protein [Candidatus Binatia bacterium]